MKKPKGRQHPHQKQQKGKKPPGQHQGPHIGRLNLVVPVPGHRHKPPPSHHHKQHPARKLALGEGWPCCSAEALGASLRLTGWPVGDADVLALHVAAGGSRDAGVSIAAALEAASEFGLAGVRPRVFRPANTQEVADGQRLILGVELPGPHALTVDGPGAWSWGEWYPWGDFPGAVIEEEWAVTWPQPADGGGDPPWR